MTRSLNTNRADGDCRGASELLACHYIYLEDSTWENPWPSLPILLCHCRLLNSFSEGKISAEISAANLKRSYHFHTRSCYQQNHGIGQSSAALNPGSFLCAASFLLQLGHVLTDRHIQVSICRLQPFGCGSEIMLGYISNCGLKLNLSVNKQTAGESQRWRR